MEKMQSLKESTISLKIFDKTIQNSVSYIYIYIEREREREREIKRTTISGKEYWKFLYKNNKKEK